MSEEISWVDGIFKLNEDKIFHSQMAQIRTKALLKEISEKPPAYDWTYTALQVIRNMTGALFTLQEIGQKRPEMLDQLQSFTLQLARTWERLAKLEEKVTKETATMNAAVMYELAGYQANAVCLSKKLGLNFYEVSEPKVTDLTNAFMQRLFLQLRTLSAIAQIEPNVKDKTPPDVSNAIYLGLCAKAFDLVSSYFLRGDKEAIEKANKFFTMSERGFAYQGCITEANLIRSVRSLLPIMVKRSTWNSFEAMVEENPRWKRYLKLSARGAGNNLLKSPSMSELWPSQNLAVANGLLNPALSKIIRMPTSAGKTRVAELAIVHTLSTIPNAKCVYIAPYRALVSEIEQAFLNLFGDLGFQVTSIVGSYETDDFEKLIVSNADIWIITPEKLDLLNRAKPEFLNNVRLFVLDEAHVMHDEGRGVKFELLLSRLKRRLINARFLFLSAVVPQETLNDFATWLSANTKEDITTTDWRPSHQRLATFDWEGLTGVLHYLPDEDIPQLKEFVPGIISQRMYQVQNKKGKLVNEIFPDLDSKSQTAAELAFRLAGLGPVLIFCSQTNFVEAVAQALEKLIHLSLSKDKTLPTYFLKGDKTRSAQVAEEWLGEKHNVTRLIKAGIAVHYGSLPEAVRKSIETDFRNREFQVLIATNTLAQGVNLPIRTVIIHSVWRFDETIYKMKRIPARDYWNIAGRAGRAGQETEGTIIHIVEKTRDRSDFQYFVARKKDVEPVKSALLQLLEDLVHERISEENLGVLDPEILALLVEEGSDFFSEQNLENVLDNTLVNTQASRTNVPTKLLREAFVDLAKDIEKNVPDQSFWKIFSSTGLSTESCKKLKSYIEANQTTIKSYFKESGPSDISGLSTLFLHSCIDLSEMQSKRETSVSHEALMLLWIKGFSIPQIISELGQPVTASKDLAKLIEDLFEYRLPWGFSGFIEISKKVLGIADNDVSKYVTYFPAMVKFGVPTAEASWAMTAGMPFRKVAIEIAAKYLQEKSSDEREEFIKWLKKIDTEQLHYEYGLEGQILEDVNQALAKAGPNDFLKEHTSIEEILPYETYVVGISFENRFVVASSAKEGEVVTLVREYNNTTDRNAISVVYYGQTIGYLDRQLAQLVAVDIDCGLSLYGKIISVTKDRVPTIKIRIYKTG